ncbi:MAG: DUF262 domain-containing HNH endonuclease family protein, partial [Candidatus Bathyarchaeota archaeon]|nr:DUF262 domain-containing HNH endonuclease family protein [Candidatus Bathyarchaeota archaeon]
IKPIDTTIRTLLETAFLKIPRFQRPYSWDRENVSDFWQDTIVAEDPDYFIGSFVVFKPSATANSLFIVDGQQRLTTITLLLAAIRNAFDREDEPSLALGVQNLIEKKDIDNSLRFVLESETPYPYLQEYIQKRGEPELPASSGAEEDALKSGYDFLSEQLSLALKAIEDDPSLSDNRKKGAKKAKLTLIRDKILCLQLILIQLTNEDDAYLIFETLNTRGKDLTVADLVKNHLTRSLKPKNKGVDVAREKWNKILELLDSSSQDIEVSRFLHHSWLTRHPYVPEKKLFKEIKRIVTTKNAAKYLDDLLFDSQLYRALVEPDFGRCLPSETQINESLRAISLFRVVQSLPMLLAVLRAYKTKRLTIKQASSVVRSMENFHFQYSAVTAQRTGGGTALMFSLAARQLGASKDKNQSAQVLKDFTAKLKKRLPTQREYEAAFAEIQYMEESSKQRPLVKYILSRLDQHSRKAIVVDYEKMTIEHISPQKPRSGAVSSASIGCIGNLILVSQTLNDKLANKPFDRKKRIMKSAGIELDALLTNSTRWTPKEIKARLK